MQLNLGCGEHIMIGKETVNVDIHEYKSWGIAKEQGAMFAVADLTKTWPWNDDTIDAIYAKDILEHLPDQIHSMMEGYRVLKPGGVFHIWVPTTDSLAAFADPTHKSYWNANTFYYFTTNKDKSWNEPIYSELIPNRFKLLGVKLFTYRDLPQSRGVYVQLQKPNPEAEDESEK